jgi:AcrR family transcriptional regulator
MKTVSVKKRRQNSADADTLTTEDWLRVARDALIRDGIGAVKIDLLAKSCGVTRGGFYWRFKSRKDLLDQLLVDWVNNNTVPLLDALEAEGTAEERYQRLVNLFINEDIYRRDYDTAIRAWARTVPSVASVVKKIDQRRIDAIIRIFLLAGYSKDEAFIRARITYCYQIGYFILGLSETKEQREALRDRYDIILFGAQFGSKPNT